MYLETRPKTARERPVWLPPLVGAGTLFLLFVTAMLVRRAGFGDAGRITMISLSSLAGAGIALYGVKMLVDARERGWPSAVAGAVMGFLGVYTLLHVLR
jgi:hypothetical protein